MNQRAKVILAIFQYDLVHEVFPLPQANNLKLIRINLFNINMKTLAKNFTNNILGDYIFCCGKCGWPNNKICYRCRWFGLLWKKRLSSLWLHPLPIKRKLLTFFPFYLCLCNFLLPIRLDCSFLLWWKSIAKSWDLKHKIFKT